MLLHLIHLVGVTLCILSSAAAEPLHVPLRRSPILRAHFVTPPATPARYVDVSSRSSRRGLFGFTGPFYFTEISIGTPAQTFKMMVDTSTSTTMVWGKGCTGCPTGAGSPYDSTKSSTAANKTTTFPDIPFGDGGIGGTIFADTLSVGPFSIPKAEFLQVSQVTDDLPSAISGILGLAFAGTVETTAQPFWKALIANGGASTPQMGFWLSRTDETAGAFTFGGVNNSLFSGDIEFLGVAAGSTGLGFWMLDVSVITVGGKSINITPNATTTMFDTTSNQIIGPEADVRAIYAAIPGSSESVETVFQFPCNTTVSVSVSFGGRTWTIDPQDMNQGPVEQGSPDCFGAIGSETGDQTPSWKFGIPFLRNVYSVFRENPPSIGFAELSTVAGGTGTLNASASTGSSSSSSHTSSATSSSSSLPDSPGADASTSTKKSSNVGAIAGGVSAGVIVMLLIIASLIFCRMRRRRTTDPSHYAVSAFHTDVEALAPPSSSSSPSAVVMTETTTSPSRTRRPSSGSIPSSAALQSMKRAQAAAVGGHYREPSNNLMQTSKGLQLSLSPGTSSSYLSDSLSPSTTNLSPILTTPSPPLPLPPGAQAATAPAPAPTDPAVLRELQTLRDEVRQLVAERNDPPPLYA
ncbi:aspartic peptidase domain-containing protein [Mycena capillaripes]|nr:aspartic peptidase domain-containing protein [Mycena capillaripes]